MDLALKASLLKRLEGEDLQIVTIQDFFNGNTDEASIGCNLIEHPGLGTFRQILLGLEKHPEVEAVFVQISEADPGPDSWPFTDTIWVVGTISQTELTALLAPLGPDDVAPADLMGAPQEFLWQHSNKVMGAWWD